MNIRSLFFIPALALATIACTSNSNTSETGSANAEAAASAAAVSYDVDKSASSLAWTGKKITGEGHNGTIDISEGTLAVEGSNLTAGNFVIDMASIKDLDIEDPEYNTKLVGHLTSDDFFSVGTYPTATFAITKVEPATDDATASHYVYGNLTIKGNTNEVKIPAQVSLDGETLTANAKFAIDRAKWDVRYGSGSFFDDLGDKVILDNIDFDLKLVAQRSGDATQSANSQQ